MSDVDTQDKTATKFDADAFAMNIARAMESSGQALAADLQHRMGKAYLDLWGSTVRRMAGEDDVKPAIEPSPRDKRFQDPEWKSNQFFDFVMQLYLLTTQWAHDLVRDAEGLDPHTRKKAEFYVQQISNALSP